MTGGDLRRERKQNAPSCRESREQKPGEIANELESLNTERTRGV